MATRLVEQDGCSRHISRSVCDLTINCASTRSCTDTSSDVSATEGCSPELNFYCAFLCWKFIVEYILSYIPTSYDYCPRPDRGQEGFFAGCFLFWCNITFCYSRTHNYSTLIKRLWRAMLSRASKGLLALPRSAFAAVSVVGRSKHTLPDLPYDYGALEPHISAEIMELHYSKHHATYVNNLNVAEEKYAEAQEAGVRFKTSPTSYAPCILTLSWNQNK